MTYIADELEQEYEDRVAQRRAGMQQAASARPGEDISNSILISQYNAYLNTLTGSEDYKANLLAEYCEHLGVISLPGQNSLGVSLNAAKRWREGRTIRNLCNSNAVTRYPNPRKIAGRIIFTIACVGMLAAGILFALEVWK